MALRLTYATTSRALQNSCPPATRRATTYKEINAKHAGEANPEHHATAFNYVQGPNPLYLSLADPSRWPLGHPVGLTNSLERQRLLRILA